MCVHVLCCVGAGDGGGGRLVSPRLGGADAAAQSAVSFLCDTPARFRWAAMAPWQPCLSNWSKIQGQRHQRMVPHWLLFEPVNTHVV